MTDPTPEQISASRRKLLTLIAIAFVPIFIAILAFQYFPAMVPSGTTNQGTLISPPVDGASVSEQLSEYSTWVLMQPVDQECDEDCQQLLYLSRQVVTGLGKDATRIQRAVVSDQQPGEALQALLANEHRDLVTLQGDVSLLEAVNASQPLLFLMDPNGNVMMYFSLDKAGKPMLRDLKHLLKLSKIG